MKTDITIIKIKFIADGQAKITFAERGIIKTVVVAQDIIDEVFYSDKLKEFIEYSNK